MIRIGGIKNIEFKDIRVYPYDMSGWFLSRIIVLTDAENNKFEIELQASEAMSMKDQNVMLSFGFPVGNHNEYKFNL